MGSNDSADHMVAVTAKVPRELRDRIDAVAADDEPRSAAIRRLLRAGLDATSTDGTGSLRDRLIGAGLVALLLGFPTLAAARGAVGLAALFIALWVVIVLARPLLARATSGLPDPINWLE